MCEAEIKAALMGARRAQLQLKDAKLQSCKAANDVNVAATVRNAEHLQLMAQLLADLQLIKPVYIHYI